MPSSFSIVLSSALVYSTSPPVSVSGTVYNVGAISWNPFAAEQNHYARQLTEFVTTHRLRNIHLIPIDYAFRPRLRGRLTLRRLALRRNPWTFGDSVSHTVCRYSCQHSRFRYLQEPSRVSLHWLTERSATAHVLLHTPKASARDFSPVTLSAQEPLIRPVSCYAFFK